eukprot:CAMPEP_0168835248 /NCGR_PEP_ID=MMETSP0727-20121128/3996_1 /TAXON_ID=265536 /ORGANISM="Amphiprora sp., Strain CCMP467" /LENGTH=117 /DNA_ID=CAMNT_0008888599 /DNA_START=258 /DNA_END=611 /DNA_ORIENTATION=-
MPCRLGTKLPARGCARKFQILSQLQPALVAAAAAAEWLFDSRKYGAATLVVLEAPQSPNRFKFTSVPLAAFWECENLEQVELVGQSSTTLTAAAAESNQSHVGLGFKLSIFVPSSIR